MRGTAFRPVRSPASRSLEDFIYDLPFDAEHEPQRPLDSQKPNHMSFLIATVGIAVILTVLLCWKPTPKSPRTLPRCEGFSLCEN
jgi:hypothetical protein